MDAVTLLAQFLAKTLFLAIPFGVAWLAFRRLALSETSNAWIYAGTGLFAAFTAAGLAPWAFGMGSVGWLYFIFAALCPILWLGVVVICGLGHPPTYDTPQDDIAEDWIAPFRIPTPLSPTLILERPEWPDAPSPTFRHHDAVTKPANENVPLATAEPDNRMLEIARNMRGNATSAARRLRPLLPPPDAMSELRSLPFLNRTS
jgi:hypothetical protein